MKNEQILRAISDIENELILEAKEDMDMTKKKTVRPLRIALIAAAAVLLLAGSVWAITSLTDVEAFLHNSLAAEYKAEDCLGLNVVETIYSGAETSCKLKNGDVVLVTDNQSHWYLHRGQTVDISVEIEPEDLRIEGATGYGLQIGYIRCDESNTAVEALKIVSLQTKETADCTFTVPTDGNYYFYFLHVASDPYVLKSFSVNPK